MPDEKTENVENELNVDDINPEESVEAERDLAEIREKETKEKETEEINQPSEGILKRIKDGLLGKSSDEEVETESKEEVGEDIPDDFTEAALAVGWDEKEIEGFASDYSDDELLEMISCNQFNKEIQEKKSKVEPEKKAEPEAGEKEAEEDDSKLAALEKKLANLENKLSETDKIKEQQENIRIITMAEDFFDRISNEFEVFGKTENMKRFPDGSYVTVTPQFKARSQVWDDARLLYNSGLSFDKALKKALNAYKGEHLENSVTRKVIKDVKNNEKRLSPDRYNKVTGKTYKDETERREDVVKNEARKAGYKGFE